ncbi:hypothetical protein RYX36_025160 [Vicia faba]
MEMAADKVVETVIVGNYEEMENEGKPQDIKSKLSNFLWHGGYAYDSWFSCASNQVAQVLLTLPYSFSQLGMLSGILFNSFMVYLVAGLLASLAYSMLNTEQEKREKKLTSEAMLFNGLKFLMDSFESTGETLVWPLTAHFFCLDLLSNL